MLTDERWVPIHGYEGRYEVSDREQGQGQWSDQEGEEVMADGKKPKRLLGTSRDRSGAQIYVAPSARRPAERGGDAMDAFYNEGKNKNYTTKKSVDAGVGVISASVADEANRRRSRKKENTGAKGRVGKPRGGK
jgi:hypothetical protein